MSEPTEGPEPAKIRVVGTYFVLPNDPGVYWHDGKYTVDLSWDTDLVERLRPQIERFRKQVSDEPMTSKPDDPMSPTENIVTT